MLAAGHSSMICHKYISYIHALAFIPWLLYILLFGFRSYPCTLRKNLSYQICTNLINSSATLPIGNSYINEACKNIQYCETMQSTLSLFKHAYINNTCFKDAYRPGHMTIICINFTWRTHWSSIYWLNSFYQHYGKFSFTYKLPIYYTSHGPQ